MDIMFDREIIPDGDVIPIALPEGVCLSKAINAIYTQQTINALRITSPDIGSFLIVPRNVLDYMPDSKKERAKPKL